MIEKRWSAVAPVALIAIGTARGKVTVTSTAGFHVKMEVTLSHPTQPELILQVKRVLSATEMLLGPTDKPLDKYSDLSAYDTQSIIYAKEQSRPAIPLQEIERAMYAEEPAVALRTLGVDQFGNPYSEDNPLHVVSNSDVSSASIPRIINLPISSANVEVSQALPANTKNFIFKVRDGASTLKFSFEAGKLDTQYMTLSRGSVYQSPTIKSTQQVLYFSSDKAGVVVEILLWI